MNVGKIKRRIIKKCMLCCSLTFLMIIIVANMNHSFNQRFMYDINGTLEMVRTGDVNTVSFKELSRLKKSEDFYKITGYSEIISMVSNRFVNSADNIKVVLTNKDYIEIYKRKLLAGRFLDEEAAKRNEAYAVISDKLAVELFKTIDVIGNEIQTLGKEYTVSGVYKSDGSILWDMCSDGFDRIFISYGSDGDYLEKPVDVLAVCVKPVQNSVEISFKLEKALGSKIYSYRMIEHSITATVYQQYFDLMLFVIGSTAIVLTLIFLFRCFTNAIRLLRKKADSYYFSALLKAEPRSFLLLLSVIFICSFCIILLIKCMQFEFVIADKFIPEDNIFDIQFYMRAIQYSKMTSELYTSNVYSVFEYIYKNALQLELICILLAMSFFIGAIMFFNLLTELDMNFASILRLILVTTLVGCIAGICISMLLGLENILHLNSWFVIAYFLMILFCRYTIIDHDSLLFFSKTTESQTEK